MSIKQAPWKEQKSRRFLWNPVWWSTPGGLPCTALSSSWHHFLASGFQNQQSGTSRVVLGRLGSIRSQIRQKQVPHRLWTYISGATTRLFPRVRHVCSTGRSGAEVPRQSSAALLSTRADGHVVLLVPSNEGSLPDGKVQKGNLRQRYSE